MSRLVQIFSHQYNIFFEELLVLFPSDVNIQLVKVYLDGLKKEEILEKMVSKLSQNLEEKIKERSINHMFEILSIPDCWQSIFLNMIQPLDLKTKETIWKWIDLFIKITKKYKDELSL